MKYLMILSPLFLAGCLHTIPAKPGWPKGPQVGQCPELEDAVPSEKLSDILSTVTKNYGKYHECTARVEAWEQWYIEQQKIYKDAK